MLTNDGPPIASSPESDGYTCDVFLPTPVQVPVFWGYGESSFSWGYGESPKHERPQEMVRVYVAVTVYVDEEVDEVVDVDVDFENKRCK